MARTRRDPPPDPTPAPLTESQLVFVEEYLVDLNGTRAYRAAYPAAAYATARACASRLLAKDNIRREIRSARAAQQRRTGITADKVLKEIARVAFSDIGDLYEDGDCLLHPREVPLETRRAVASFRVHRERTTVTRRTREGKLRIDTAVREEVIDYTLSDKMEALGRLWNHLGLSTPIPTLGELLATLPAELADAVRAELARAR